MADTFVNRLLTKEATELPSDNVRPDELQLQLPEWFEEEKYNRGRQFFWENCFGFAMSIAMGILVVLSVPTILRVTSATSRSTSAQTTFQRYLSTMLHTLAWFQYDLKPGSPSWKSLHSVRKRHIYIIMEGKRKGFGMISQRDLALSLFAFFSLAFLKPDKFGIKQLRKGDWEAYNHFWRVIAHMVGTEDRYNICRPTPQDTREISQLLLERVFTPCLEIMPEHYDQMARILLEKPLGTIPLLNFETTLYFSKSLANVPGYVCTEEDRIHLQRRLKDKLIDEATDTGVSSSLLVSKHMDDLSPTNERQLYLHDYDTLESAPEYKQLSIISKWKMSFVLFTFFLYSTSLGRKTINFLFVTNLYLVKNFPFQYYFWVCAKLAFIKSFVFEHLNILKFIKNTKNNEENN